MRAAARLFVQVGIQTRKAPAGFCAHYYDTNVAAFVMRGCDHARQIGGPEIPRG